MNSTLDAALRSWPAKPWLVVALALIGAIYGRGWLVLHRRAPHRWHTGRLVAFWAGLATIFLALASPIESFASLLLQVHMVQHVLLMMAVPPLIWLGAPLLPLLRGLPEPIRTYWVAPLFGNRSIRRFFTRLTHPIVALLLFTIATWLWHWPAAYELALRSPDWHYAQHLCFLGAALLFWFPVVRPYPSRPRWSNWILLPYLFFADVQNTLLAALLTFSNRLLYPYYAEVPRLGGLPAAADQSAAGVIMWVPGSIVFLVPLFWIGIRLLYGDRVQNKLSRPTIRNAVALRTKGSRGFDLLHLPLLGRMLKWRHARVAMQIPMFLLAALLIIDGLRGPQVAPMNLAGVLPWIHWRGLLILSLLALGNVFCMACPFMLPRTVARRWLPANRHWPRALRSKWVAVGLLGLFLWSYEAFSLWDSPWWTAWIAIGYFVAAFAIDGLFRGAVFCKYLCPIGQFNFVQSLMSPLEIKVREPARCVTCTTKDCIRGGSDSGGADSGRNGIPGCELKLYQPGKAGNMDCTFCLDCIHACPHDNIGILIAPPGKELWHDPLRSGIGRFARRPDLAALVLILVFGAFANAAGMVGPVVEWQQAMQSRLQLGSPLVIVSGCYLMAIVVLPLLLVAVAAAMSRRVGSLEHGLVRTATRYSFALVPLGFSMWLAHYSFHLFSSYDTVIPATQRFVADMGLSIFGAPQWSCSCCRPVSEWLPRLEILFLDFGLLLSLYTAFRIARNQSSRTALAIKALVPWAMLIGLLFAAGIWIVLQPMQMRGMMPGG
jgi:cytochrome c oxidase assembly factor CtaG